MRVGEREGRGEHAASLKRCLNLLPFPLFFCPQLSHLSLLTSSHRRLPLSLLFPLSSHVSLQTHTHTHTKQPFHLLHLLIIMHQNLFGHSFLLYPVPPFSQPTPYCYPSFSHSSYFLSLCSRRYDADDDGHIHMIRLTYISALLVIAPNTFAHSLIIIFSGKACLFSMNMRKDACTHAHHSSPPLATSLRKRGKKKSLNSLCREKNVNETYMQPAQVDRSALENQG